jgi:squalene/oxidosqualene cyclase-like protein
MEAVVQNGIQRAADGLGAEAQPSPLDRSIDKALAHLHATQADTGAWLGDYGGPLFLVPQYLGSHYGARLPIPHDVLADMLRYLRNTQNDDGGWGLHVESHSYQFTSTIIYATMRLWGEPADAPHMMRARKYIRDHGGPLAAASWGKFFLALLNLYDYRGLNPVPPELWLLPPSLPMHPSRMWCHARMVYLPMSYLYGARVQMPVDDTVRAIRSELYNEPYQNIDWEKGRNLVAPSDDYTPLSDVMKAINKALLAHEALPVQPLRARAMAYVLDQIEAEDRNTNYVCLGPVNKAYHLWVWHHARPHGPELKKHAAKFPEYLWQAEDGTKVQGYHSSQLWDTAFAVQAMLATDQPDKSAAVLARAHHFIEDNQVQRDLPLREASFRDPTKGGWGFSAKDNGWIVSDCTAEGLRAALALAKLVPEPMSQARLRDAVDYLLWSQMPCGGWASYEPARAPDWMELLNVSNVFGDIMIDYPYVECTAAALMGLVQYRAAYPGDRDEAIAGAVERGRDFLFSRQRPDGSFEGSWGICFTYGTWFGIEGMRAAGVRASHERVVRAVTFLEQHQLPDGGWGETAESCYRRAYVHADKGQAVMTSWALLGLLAGGRVGSKAVAAGVKFLIGAQRDDGTYPPEHIAGMFNKTCAIHYDNYLKVFPLWALGEARRHGVFAR